MPRRTALCSAGTTILALLLGGEPGSSGSAGADAYDPARAVAFYEEGRYADARPILEDLDVRGKATGTLLYRLFFCRQIAGDLAGAKQALDRATAALEREHAEKESLETAFYLANAYRNLSRPDEARRLAARATPKIESKAWPKPKRAIEVFQVAKLYEDQGRTEDAARWYRTALERFASEGRPCPGNLLWAKRYLAQQAFSRADFAQAELEYSGVVALPGATPAEWSRLGVARLRLGRYEAAAEAWAQAGKMDPVGGHDARYASRLAGMAASLESLPDHAPDGRSWKSLSQQELEEILLDRAKVVKEAQARATAEAPPLDETTRASLAKEVAAAKPVFVAAGLEYAARGLPIRATAFTSNYAPLIFHPEDWELAKRP